MGFFKNKKFCTPNVEDINFIGFQSIISWSPWKFLFFALNPLEIHVFPKVLAYPLKFQRLLLPSLPLPLEFDILNRSTGGLRLLSGKSQYITWYKLTQIFAKSKTCVVLPFRHVCLRLKINLNLLSGHK